jgi:hypothetical protein
LRPGSKIRYLLTEGGKHSCGTKNGKAKSVPRGSVPRGQRGRAMGFLDGSEAPDLAKYEEMLREAAEEVLGPLAVPHLPGSPADRPASPFRASLL